MRALQTNAVPVPVRTRSPEGCGRLGDTQRTGDKSLRWHRRPPQPGAVTPGPGQRWGRPVPSGSPGTPRSRCRAHTGRRKPWTPPVPVGYRDLARERTGPSGHRPFPRRPQPPSAAAPGAAAQRGAPGRLGAGQRAAGPFLLRAAPAGSAGAAFPPRAGCHVPGRAGPGRAPQPGRGSAAERGQARPGRSSRPAAITGPDRVPHSPACRPPWRRLRPRKR